MRRYKTCFHHVFPRDIVESKLLLPEGMSQFGKATPASTHKSHMHNIVHYPRCVNALGPLNGCTMLSDERRNKVSVSLITMYCGNLPTSQTQTQVVKDMAKQRKHCEASIARVYSDHLQVTPLVKSPPPVSLETCCVYTKTKIKHYTDTDPLLSTCLRRMVRNEYSGARSDVCLWTIHQRAKIGGTHFVAGNPLTGVRRRNEKMKRCASVITLVRGGRSLYAWVIQFMHFDRLHVAHVSWLPIPDYPTGTPVVVRLVRDNPKPNEGCIIPLIDIHPTNVSILHEDTCMYMMRMHGVDTMPRI